MGRPRKPATKSKTVYLGCRTEIGLRQKYEQFAEKDRADVSVVVRQALWEYVERRESAGVST